MNCSLLSNKRNASIDKIDCEIVKSNCMKSDCFAWLPALKWRWSLMIKCSLLRVTITLTLCSWKLQKTQNPLPTVDFSSWFQSLHRITLTWSASTFRLGNSFLADKMKRSLVLSTVPVRGTGRRIIWFCNWHNILLHWDKFHLVPLPS